MKLNSKCSLILNGTLQSFSPDGILSILYRSANKNTNSFFYIIKLDSPSVFLICIRWRHQR